MTEGDVKLIDEKLNAMRADIKEIKDRLSLNFVSLDRFKPVEKLAYGVAGLLITGVITGLLALVVKASR